MTNLLIWTPGQAAGLTDRHHEGSAVPGVPAGKPGVSAFGEGFGNKEDCAGMALGVPITALASAHVLLVQVTGRPFWKGKSNP